MIKVEITATSVADFREQLNQLLNGTGVVAPATNKTTKPADNATAVTAVAGTSQSATPSSSTPGKELKHEDLRTAWKLKKDAGVKPEKLKALLETYGADAISTLKIEDLSAALADIQKLTA